jgi:hypothetical protein
MAPCSPTTALEYVVRAPLKLYHPICCIHGPSPKALSCGQQTLIPLYYTMPGPTQQLHQLLVSISRLEEGVGAAEQLLHQGGVPGAQGAHPPNVCHQHGGAQLAEEGVQAQVGAGGVDLATAHPIPTCQWAAEMWSG